MIKSENLDKRKERPQFVAAAIAGLMKAMGGNALDSELSENWPQIVGNELAADLKVAAIGKPDKDGLRILTLQVLVPAKITILSYQADEIVRLVDKYYGRSVVKKIKLRV